MCQFPCLTVLTKLVILIKYGDSHSAFRTWSILLVGTLNQCIGDFAIHNLLNKTLSLKQHFTKIIYFINKHFQGNSEKNIIFIQDFSVSRLIRFVVNVFTDINDA